MTDRSTVALDYNRLAEEYARNRRLHPGVLAALAGAAPAGCDYLEVGCGTGNYARALLAPGEGVGWGMDPSTAMLAQASRADRGLRLCQGRAEALPFASVVFDLLYSVDVIHHVEDVEAAYREAGRVLRPGGLVCTVTDSEEIIRRRQPLSEYFPETVPVELRRYPAMGRLHAAMEQAGFRRLRSQVVEWAGTVDDLRPYRERAYSSLHLISDEAFRQGLARMEQARQFGPLPWVSRYVLLWGER